MELYELLQIRIDKSVVSVPVILAYYIWFVILDARYLSTSISMHYSIVSYNLLILIIYVAVSSCSFIFFFDATSAPYFFEISHFTTFN